MKKTLDNLISRAILFILAVCISSIVNSSERLSKLQLVAYNEGAFFVSPKVKNVLFQLGPVEADQYTEFRRALVDHDIKFIVLNSGGGNVTIGKDVLRSNGNGHGKH